MLKIAWIRFHEYEYASTIRGRKIEGSSAKVFTCFTDLTLRFSEVCITNHLPNMSLFIHFSNFDSFTYLNSHTYIFFQVESITHIQKSNAEPIRILLENVHCSVDILRLNVLLPTQIIV